MANYGYDLLKNYVANQVLNGDINSNGMDDRREYVITTPANAALRQFGVFGNNNIGVWDHTGESTYHSLQTQFVSRASAAARSSRRRTRCRDRGPTSRMTDSGQLAANTTRLDNQDPDRDWGRPETGRTHIFNSSLIWMLPIARGQLDDRCRALFGDWEIAAIIGAGTGQPLSVVYRQPARLQRRPLGHRLQRQSARQPRRGRTVPRQRRSGRADHQSERLFTLNGFRLGQIGSAERGDCTGPGYFQTDLAFYKNFPLTNGVKLQFRWDIFNIFNNTNFLFQNLDTELDPSAVVLNAAQTEIVSATIPGQLRAGDPHAGSAPDADRRQAALVATPHRARHDKGDRLLAGRPFSLSARRGQPTSSVES